MDVLIILILLSLITYFTVRRSIAGVTRTPIWLCWLVIMTPAFVWSAWLLVNDQAEPVPILPLIGSILLALVIYGWLVAVGKPQSNPTKPKSEPKANSNLTTPSPPPKDRKQLRPINANEEQALRDCFPWQIYYLDQIVYRPQAIICTGKLRAIPEEAYRTIKHNIENLFGDRYYIIFQESFRGQPFFALVPNPKAKTPVETSTAEAVKRPLLALSLLLLTFITTTWAGAEISGISSEELVSDFSLAARGLPYSLGLITILGVHESAHYLAAVKHKISVTLPYFIPVPFFLGTFGAFIQKRSPVPNRRALFDIAIAGPLAGFLVTLPILFWGLSLSQVLPIEESANVLTFDNFNPRFSFLLAVISKAALGQQLAPGMAIALHPLAIAGYLGVIVTALNLVPIGSLDGGHIVHAMYGQTTAIIVGQVTRLLMVALAFLQPYLLIWVIILWLMPLGNQPALNDVTELDNGRDLLGLATLTLLVLILLPLPGTVAGWLNL